MWHFFAPLRHIELTDFKQDYLEIVPGVRISNSQKIKSEILTDENKALMGLLELNFFSNASTFLYFNYEDDFEMFKNHSTLDILTGILGWVDDIFKNLWLIKDNCVTTDTAYLVKRVDYKFKEASSLRLQYAFNNADVKQEVSNFSLSEFESFICLHNKLENHFHSKSTGAYGFMLEKDFSRINRSLLFVKQAREARNLAYKISNFCSAFEALFSTDTMELSHKLSERIAFFMKDDLLKVETFKTMKKAYGIRSKLSHGDTLDKKHLDQLDEISIQLDSILRLSIIKIIETPELFAIFESSKNSIDAHFEELIFS